MLFWLWLLKLRCLPEIYYAYIMLNVCTYSQYWDLEITEKTKHE